MTCVASIQIELLYKVDIWRCLLLSSAIFCKIIKGMSLRYCIFYMKGTVIPNITYNLFRHMKKQIMNKFFMDNIIPASFSSNEGANTKLSETNWIKVKSNLNPNFKKKDYMKKKKMKRNFFQHFQTRSKTSVIRKQSRKKRHFLRIKSKNANGFGRKKWPHFVLTFASFSSSKKKISTK